MKSLALAMLVTLSCLPLAPHADSISKVNGSIRVTAEDRAGDVSTVNGSIHIEDGAQVGDVETVNGSINVGRSSVVQSVETVNGRVSFDQGARAGAVETVNGALTFAEKVQVSGAVGTVNGAVRLAQDASVAGDVTNVNGKISLDRAHVGGGLRTTSGDIHVGAGSRIEGGILIEKPSASWFWRRQRPPEVVIGPDAIVKGRLTFEREVQLYVSDRADVGEIEGAEPIRFSGDSPGRSERREAEMQVER